MKLKLPASDLAAFAVALVFALPAAALDMQSVNDAQWNTKADAKGLSPALVKAQVLLDRARFSPGEIDGKSGENFKKAVAAFASRGGAQSSADMTEDIWNQLNGASSDPVLAEYALKDEDVRGPFAERIPAKMEEMKDLPALSYRRVEEKIAEKFHMSEELLRALNPGSKFAAGETIVVANVSTGKLPAKAARLEVDKTKQMLRVFGKDDQVLAVYPVTAGSTEKPAPDGRMKIVGVSKNPTYRYNPDYAFKGVRAKEPFTIKPGPNNPVGVVWIGLGEGFGIHGTPEPSKISKSESHGCVRLTNWDALELASAVTKGTPVDFVGDERAAHEARAKATKKDRKRR